ncbi:MAG TPA: PIN domain-containing protein [Roseomonas sp.]|jgi:hypothetical protein
MIAFLDANILYGPRLRGLLLRLAQGGLFRPRWSDAVQDEWTRSLAANTPGLGAEALAQLRQGLHQAMPDARVAGYDALIPGLRLPDPGDRHVLAAAMACQACCIVTFNLRDFPAKVLAPFGLSALHPDRFLLQLDGRDPVGFAAALRRDMAPDPSAAPDVAGYVTSLRRAHLPRTAAHVAELAPILAR